VTIYLGLGSNLGDRVNQLRAAVRALTARGVTVARTASLYETAPKDSPPGAPWFLNTAAEAQSDLAPARLIAVCLEIEREAGRIRSAPNAPRGIDIDVLLIGDLILRTTALTVPHPRYAERRFVLAPLAEIAPDVVDPVRRVTIGQLLAACEDEAEVRPYSTMPLMRS
jgi:2-amino-4-hydroxy-6-hydroxymethyldihydropteridine diphosphokinase